VIEMMILHPLVARSEVILFALAVFLSNAGCEQRYVGGPITIVEGTPPEHGVLGVVFSDPPSELVLSEVLTDGPAFQAGIQAGDEILLLQQQAVETVEDVHSIVHSTHPGDEVVVRVLRSSKEIDFDVTLCDFGQAIALRSVHDFSLHENAGP